MSADKLMAISILLSVAGIMDALEHKNIIEVNKCLNSLKNNISVFEEIFNENIENGHYK